MGLKDELTRRLGAALTDPRVTKLLADERVIQTAVRAFELRGKVQDQVTVQVERVARAFNLATQDEVRELRRALRRVEGELDRERGGKQRQPRSVSRREDDE